MTKKYQTKGRQITPNPHMDLSREHYDRIADIAGECDMKLSNVLNQLLDFAFEHTTIEEVQIPVKKLKVG